MNDSSNLLNFLAICSEDHSVVIVCWFITMQKAEHKPFILRRIELSKVELRKAERPWVRFSEVKCDLSPTVKETQVSLCWIT